MTLNCTLTAHTGEMDAVMEPAPLPEVHFDNDAADSVLRNPDILRLLFSQLVMEDLCRAGATCRQWRAVSQSDEFWSTVDFTRRLIRQDQVRPLPASWETGVSPERGLCVDHQCLCVFIKSCGSMEIVHRLGLASGRFLCPLPTHCATSLLQPARLQPHSLFDCINRCWA